MNRPTVVDLFAGAGGMSLGFEQAGFDIAAAVEIDPVHAAAHKFNFPMCTTICRDITQVTGDDIRAAAGLDHRKVDVVIGGAPCQGFSLIGHRALDDPRNGLVQEFLRIVFELDANYFVFENVKGLTTGRHRIFLEELVSAFDDGGYCVRLPWRVLNAKDYGVPQSRERLILIGAKRGLRLPVYPEPSAERVTCSDALDDLPNADHFEALLHSDSIRLVRNAWKWPTPYAAEMRAVGPRAWHFGYPREWNSNTLTSSMRTTHSEISRLRFAETEEGETEPISRFFKLAADGVSNTLRAGTDAKRGAFTSPRPIHYLYSRCVTVREMARLHGFPDWFRFQKTKWHGARQIGNAVPPPLARAVGRALATAMDYDPLPLTCNVPLGDSALLQMDVGAASKYWSIEAPVGRRDKKSGVRKRSQIETENERLLARTADA